MSFKADCPTINLGGMYLSISTHAITFFRCHNHISEGKPRFQTWTCPLSALLLPTVVGVHSIMDCLWATLPSIDLNVFVLLSINKRNLLLLDVKHNFDGFHWIIIWLCFFASSWSKYCLHSLLTYIALSRLLNYSKSVEKCWCHFRQGYYKISPCFFFVREFSFVVKSTHPFQRSCLFKSNCWNKIREISVLKVFSKNHFFSQRPNTRHAIIYLFCILREKKLIHYKIKIVFLWFFVSILVFDFGYIILW